MVLSSTGRLHARAIASTTALFNSCGLIPWDTINNYTDSIYIIYLLYHVKYIYYTLIAIHTVTNNSEQLHTMVDEGGKITQN